MSQIKTPILQVYLSLKYIDFVFSQSLEYICIELNKFRTTEEHREKQLITKSDKLY